LNPEGVGDGGGVRGTPPPMPGATPQNRGTGTSDATKVCSPQPLTLDPSHTP